MTTPGSGAESSNNADSGADLRADVSRRPSIAGTWNATGTPANLNTRHGADSEAPRISHGELARVAPHYPLGKVKSARPYHAGSPGSPKLLLVTEAGEFLLKRRAPGATSDPFRVACAHEVALRLFERGFPTAELIGTARDGNSMLQLGGRVYELWRFVHGQPSTGTIAQARNAGAVLARMHADLAGWAPDWARASSTGGGYERPGVMRDLLKSAGDRLGSDVFAPMVDHAAWAEAKVASLLQSQTGGAAGNTVLHGDWHPGNLLFGDGDRVAAALDFDAARLGPGVLDAAQGALQFSITRGAAGDPPEKWPDNPDLGRYIAFLSGYYEERPTSDRGRLDDSEAFVGLMVLALLGEALPALATTGRFGRFAGRPFAQMLGRKSGWLVSHAGELASALENASHKPNTASGENVGG